MTTQPLPQKPDSINTGAPVVNEDAKQRVKLSTDGVLIANLYAAFQTDDEKSPAAPKKKKVKSAPKPTLGKTAPPTKKEEQSMVLIMAELTAMISQLTGMKMEIDNKVLKIQGDENDILQQGCAALINLADKNLTKINAAIKKSHEHHSWLSDLMKVVAVVALVASVFIGPGAFAFAALAFAMSQTPLGGEVTKGLEKMGMSPGLAQGVLMVTMIVAGVALGGITSAEEVGEEAAEEAGSAAEEGAGSAGSASETPAEVNVSNTTETDAEDTVEEEAKTQKKFKYNKKTGIKFGAANAVNQLAASPEMNQLIQLCLEKVGGMSKADAKKYAGYVQMAVEFIAGLISMKLMSGAAGAAAEDGKAGLSAVAKSRITTMLQSIQVTGTLAEAGIYLAQAQVQKDLAQVQKDNGHVKGEQAMNTILSQMLQSDMQTSGKQEATIIKAYQDTVSQLQGFLAADEGATYATSGMLNG